MASSITISQLPTLVTSTDGTDTQLVFSKELESLGIGIGVDVAFIEVVSGSFNFSNFGTASSINGTYIDGDKIPLTFGNGKNIHFKAASVSQTFKISV